MKYFMIESTFNNPLTVDESGLKKSIKDHVYYLQKGFNEGWILLSGPKASSAGGAILMKGSSLEEIEKYFSNDPMKKAGFRNTRLLNSSFMNTSLK